MRNIDLIIASIESVIGGKKNNLSFNFVILVFGLKTLDLSF